MINLIDELSIIQSKLSFLVSGKYWKFKSLIISTSLLFLTLYLANSLYIKFIISFFREDKAVPFYWTFIREQAKHLLSPNFAEPTSHESKLTFRFILPLLIKLFNGNIIAVYVFQILLGFVFLYFFLELVYKITQDKWASNLFLIAFIGIYAGSSFIVDSFSHGDAFAYSFLLFMVATQSPFLIFTYSQVAFWTDERAIINVGTVIICWVCLQSYFNKTDKPKKLIIKLIALLISIVTYFLIRLFLMSHYEMAISDGGANFAFILKNLGAVGLKLWGGLEAFWLLIGVTFFILLKKKIYILLVASLACLAIPLIIGFMVEDSTRSMNYCFLLLIAFLTILQKELLHQQLKVLLLLIAIICLLYPIYLP